MLTGKQLVNAASDRPQLVDREARSLARMWNLDRPRKGFIWVAVPVPEDTYSGDEDYWTVVQRSIK